MDSRRTGDTIAARFDPGEDVIEGLTKLCEREGVRCGQVQGIGAVRDVEIGAYILAEKRYGKTRLEGDWEVLSLLATVSIVDGKPYVHTHVVLGDEGMTTRGGHLFGATVAVTLECVVRVIPLEVTREMAPGVGLRLWHFPEGR